MGYIIKNCTKKEFVFEYYISKYRKDKIAIAAGAEIVFESNTLPTSILQYVHKQMISIREVSTAHIASLKLPAPVEPPIPLSIETPTPLIDSPVINDVDVNKKKPKKNI